MNVRYHPDISCCRYRPDSQSDRQILTRGGPEPNRGNHFPSTEFHRSLPEAPRTIDATGSHKRGTTALRVHMGEENRHGIIAEWTRLLAQPVPSGLFLNLTFLLSADNKIS